MVFRPDGAIPCQEPLHPEEDPYLAGIGAAHITPPQTVASMIRCIHKKENLEFDPTISGELFQTVSSTSPLERQRSLADLTRSGLGSDPRKPLAFVLVDALDQSIRAMDVGRNEHGYAWLCYANGDVLHTDRVLLNVKYGPHDNRDAYLARDKSGCVGYVSPFHFR